MGKLLNIIPVSDLRQSAAKILKNLKKIETDDGYDLDSVLSEADLLLTRDPS